MYSFLFFCVMGISLPPCFKSTTITCKSWDLALKAKPTRHYNTVEPLSIWDLHRLSWRLSCSFKGSKKDVNYAIKLHTHLVIIILTCSICKGHYIYCLFFQTYCNLKQCLGYGSVFFHWEVPLVIFFTAHTSSKMVLLTLKSRQRGSGSFSKM